MKTQLSVLAAALILISSGCGDLLSVHPLATAETTVFDTDFIGEWSCEDTEPADVALVRPSAAQKKSYDIAWIPGDRDEVLRLKGQLVAMGDHLVFDLSINHAIWGARLLHFFMLVEKTADGLTLHSLDSPWLQRQVTSQDGLGHIMPGDTPLITGGGAEIDAFLAKFALDPLAVSDSLSFKRAK